MAAVRATTSGRTAPIATSSSLNASVHPRFDAAVGRPVAGSNAAGLCRQSSSSFSAGG
jgi:hypothetical protein